MGDIDLDATGVVAEETFDKDDEEGDEEVEMVRNSVDNTDLVIFLSEVEVKYFGDVRYQLQCAVFCAFLKLMLFWLRSVG